MTSEIPECSRAGCRASASWNINWRNPRIHPEERVKVWLACGEHREFLYEYLSSRGFPVSAQKRDAVPPMSDEPVLHPDAAP